MRVESWNRAALETSTETLLTRIHEHCCDLVRSRARAARLRLRPSQRSFSPNDPPQRAPGPRARPQQALRSGATILAQEVRGAGVRGREPDDSSRKDACAGWGVGSR